MATLAAGGRITTALVDAEIARLRAAVERKARGTPGERGRPVPRCWTPTRWRDIDLFDRVQLDEVIRVCRASHTLSDAGRHLFAVSREKRSAVNDADRLRKYLLKFGLGWEQVRQGSV